MARSSTTFGPGNQAAVTHGGRSQRLRAEARQRLRAELRRVIQTALPELQHADALLVDLLEDALADLRQIREYIDAMGGPVSPRGQLRKCMDMYRGRLHDAVSLLDRLGVGPKARAQIVGSLSARPGNDLAAQLARARLELAGRNGGSET
jgi:hypothetical protein